MQEAAFLRKSSPPKVPLLSHEAQIS